MKKYIEEFIDLGGTLFTKGIVIKYFVSFKKYGNTNEYRAFYLRGKLVTLSKNSNQSSNCPVVPMDFAELENGKWIIIEAGDGQVSGLSPDQYIFKFYDEIRAILIV